MGRLAIPVLGVLLALAACGEPPATPSQRVVVTTWDTRRAPALGYPPLPLPHARWPVGSSLSIRDLARENAGQLLSDGMTAAGGAVCSLDGERVYFVGKERFEEPYAVWSCRLDGRERRRVVTHDGDCGSVAVLPDGRLVYAAETGEPAVLRGTSSAWALYVLEAGAEMGRRITFGAGFDVDPWVLSDGRIVYASWQPGGWGEEGEISLFTVHPDGTGAAKLPGEHGGRPFAVRPRQMPNGDVVYLRRDADHRTPDVHRADWRSTEAPVQRLDLDRVTLSAAPRRDGALLLMVQPREGESERGRPVLIIVHPDGSRSQLRWQPPHPFQVVDATPVEVRPRPQGHLSTLDASRSRGQLLCLDARLTASPDAARVRLTALSGPHAGGLRPGGVPLGEVPLHEDGSFFVEVPADVPLLLDLLDADGRALVSGRTPFWVRPNEVRACVGCHEDQETAPSNRRPRAVLEDAVVLGSASGGGAG